MIKYYKYMKRGNPYMANCPKCGRKLHLTDWKPECPDCHVNMIYYKANERLLADSEKAEIEHAKSQPGIDRAKAAFFGSKFAIIRIVLSFIAIGPLFLPLWKSVDAGGAAHSFNALDIYKVISEVPIGNIFGNALKGDLAAIGVAGMLISAVLILVGIILLFMSLGKHGRLRNHIINGVKLAGALTGAVAGTLAFRGPETATSVLGSGCASASVGIGMILYILLIIALIVYNEVLHRKNLITVRYTECLIGGLPSGEYFKMVEDGVSELEIRKKMVSALTKLQEEVRAKEKKAEEENMKKVMERK